MRTEKSDGALEISWCGDASRADELAKFFSENVSARYISHSELQGARALTRTKWRPNLRSLLRSELVPRLETHTSVSPAKTSQPIAVAEASGIVRALSFVTFAGSAPVPFGIVEDLIVDPAYRGKKIGRAMIKWIGDEAKKRKIKRLFLESGKHNERAHHFFHEVGFEVCSLVMMKSL
jgi:GNAT superfamily N-acetyltransferase